MKLLIILTILLTGCASVQVKTNTKRFNGSVFYRTAKSNARMYYNKYHDRANVTDVSCENKLLSVGHDVMKCSGSQVYKSGLKRKLPDIYCSVKEPICYAEDTEVMGS